MGLLVVLFGLVLIISLISFFIAWAVRKRLVKKGNKNAKVIGIVTFIGSFLLMGAGLFVVLVLRFPFDR